MLLQPVVNRQDPLQSLGRWSSPPSATISGEEPLILFDVSTAENLSTKSLIDRCSSSIRAGGEGQVADCNKLSERFAWRDGPADELIVKSVSFALSRCIKPVFRLAVAPLSGRSLSVIAEVIDRLWALSSEAVLKKNLFWITDWGCCLCWFLPFWLLHNNLSASIFFFTFDHIHECLLFGLFYFGRLSFGFFSISLSYFLRLDAADTGN